MNLKGLYKRFVKRWYHTTRLKFITSYVGRAEYIKKHHILGGIGKNCRWGPRKYPFRPELVILHDNVTIHQTAFFVPHDMINVFLKATCPQADLGKRERLGCIEIMDNVYISMRSVIMPNVRVNRNCLICADSVVTADVPENSVVAGNPARVIGKLDQFVAIRTLSKDDTFAPTYSNQDLPKQTVRDLWEKFRESRNHSQSPADPRAQEPEADNPLIGQIIRLLTENINGVDFSHEQNLVDGNALDSMGLITVTALLEDAFHITVPFSETTAYNFNSVAHMAQMVSRLLSADGAERAQAETSGQSRSGKGTEPLALNERDTELPVVERIFRNASEHPELPAIIADDTTTSYQKLADMILSISGWLKEEGVRQGDTVCVQAMHDPLCVACYYAIHLLGAILVPVEKSASNERILEIAEETKARKIISISAQPADISWSDYAAARSFAGRAQFRPGQALTFPALDLPCEMVFTTGTTGKSKGVLMTHRNISWYAYSIAKCVQMKKNNRFLLTTPLNHAGGLRRTHLMLANACCMVYLDGLKDLGKYFRTIEAHHVTSLYLPPVALRILLSRTGDQIRQYQDQIDFVYCSSSSLPLGDSEKLRELLPHTRLYNAYEASETPGVSAYDFNREKIVGSCLGAPNDGVELAILPEDGTLTREPDRRGQICVRSKMNMQEYYLAPELTASVFRGDWFVSNDLGSLDRKGQLHLYGRKGDVINIGGYKIAPTDVEEAALASGLINECICIEDFDEYKVPFLKLLVVVEDAGSFDAKELSQYISRRLEAYKVPRKIECVDGIHKTFNGKIDRKAYRK